MMKRMLSALLMISGALSAETFGNIEWQFPPSNFEWKALFEQNTLNILSFDDEEKPAEEAMSPFKLFTHREGDALELFVVFQGEYSDQADQEKDVLEDCQKQLDEALNQFFANHKTNLLSLTDHEEGGFCEWEFTDGTNDLAHGMLRLFKHREDNALKALTVLCYFSTAQRTEYNQMLWTDVLKQARVLN